MSLKLDHQLCFALYSASRQVIQRYTPLLKPLQLTYTQYITMLALWEEHPQTVKELGNKLALDSGTLTPLLKKLASLGYITRERGVDDERLVLIELTPKGLSLREQAKEIPKKIASCFPLSLEAATELSRLLTLIRQEEQTQTCLK